MVSLPVPTATACADNTIENALVVPASAGIGTGFASISVECPGVDSSPLPLSGAFRYPLPINDRLPRLPLGLSDFDALREDGQDYLYVDKTQALHTLLDAGNYIFLARPRRFGKSLLCFHPALSLRGPPRAFRRPRHRSGRHPQGVQHPVERHPREDRPPGGGDVRYFISPISFLFANK